MEEHYDVAVVGFGVAGLAATLAAIETFIAREERDARVCVLERAARQERGGNTRWSTATFRMKDPETLNDDFVAAFAPRTVGADAYVSVLAARAVDSVGWASSFGLDFVPDPDLYLTSRDPRIWPVGAGAAIVDTFGRHVEDAARGRFFGAGGEHALGVDVLYETTARSLTRDEDGAITGLVVRERSGLERRIRASAVVIASGGFQGNAEMMTRYVGFHVPTVSRGGGNNRGEGIEMALAVGAAGAGQWNEYHPLPADPRTGSSGVLTFAAVMQTVPYGVLVDGLGHRFMDEGADSMDQMYDVVARNVQRLPGQLAHLIFDASVFDVPGYRKAVAKDQVHEPITAHSLAELADLIGVARSSLEATISRFNTATPGDRERFDPARPDGFATSGLMPAKSNWAIPIEAPPFFAYPVTCANVFTFGGIATDETAAVIDADGSRIPGLFAAGEATGLYHGDYVGATSVLRGLVFGRIAGERAADHALAPVDRGY